MSGRNFVIVIAFVFLICSSLLFVGFVDASEMDDIEYEYGHEYDFNGNENETDDGNETDNGNETGTDDFNWFITPVADGSVRDVDRLSNMVEYSGYQLLVTFSFDEPTNVDGLRVQDGEVNYDSVWSTDNVDYTYKLEFGENGNHSVFVRYQVDGDVRESVLRFVIDDSDVVVVDEDLFDEYRSHYLLNMDNLAEIEDIMGVTYDDDLGGVNDAYMDVLEDSRALRGGPERFGEHMFMVTLTMFFNPYFALLILVIIAVMSVKLRSYGNDISKIKEGEDYKIDRLEERLARSIKDKTQKVLSRKLDMVAPALNIRRSLSSSISRDIINLNHLADLLASATINENEFSGELKDLIVDWCVEHVKVVSRSDTINDRDVEAPEKFPKAIYELVDFMVNRLGMVEYDDYLKYYDTVVEEVKDAVDDRFDESITTKDFEEDIDIDTNDMNFGL